MDPAAPPRGSAPRALINQVNDWLMQQALKDNSLEAIVMGCCERMRAIGIPLVRGFFAFSVLHPLHAAVGLTWNRGEGVAIDDYPHTAGRVDNYRKSPFYHMEQRDLSFLRVCLDCGTRQYDFPVFKELREQGITDYLAFRIPFDRSGERGVNGSWATDHGAGFSETDIDAIMRIQDSLAVATKMAIQRKLMENVTTTYLGRSAGDYVLSGQIKRGDGQSIKAAIWHADIRGSTAMADQLSSQSYIDTLNSFFDATGGAVTANGGEILAFIGDGLLAIYPTDSTEATVTAACEKALAACLDAQDRLAKLNETRRAAGDPPIGYGISLHLGEVMYGNVGIPERLAFSAFGAAVNEVTRIDQLTKKLGEPLLASEGFASVLELPWRPLGRHNLRGVDRPMSVFGPPQPDGSSTPKRRRQRAEV